LVDAVHAREDEAEGHFLNAMRFGAVNPEVHLYYGRWLQGDGRLDEARRMLEKGLEYSPEHRGLVSQLKVLSVLSEGSGTAWLESLSRKAAESPTTENYLNLSLAYYRADLFLESIETCKRALEIDPELAVAYNNMCSAYVKLGEFTSAIEACIRALEIAPDFSRAQANLLWARDSLEADAD
jgi:tetratricopeptide (TPR) repeat protein